MMAALAPHEVVNLLVDDAETESKVRSRCQFTGGENVHFHQIPTVASWIRAYGPNFLIEMKRADKLPCGDNSKSGSLEDTEETTN